MTVLRNHEASTQLTKAASAAGFKGGELARVGGAGGEGSGLGLGLGQGLRLRVRHPQRSPGPLKTQLHQAQTPRSKEDTYIVCAQSSEASPALFTDQSRLFKYLISTE